MAEKFPAGIMRFFFLLLCQSPIVNKSTLEPTERKWRVSKEAYYEFFSRKRKETVKRL